MKKVRSGRARMTLVAVALAVAVTPVFAQQKPMRLVFIDPYYGEPSSPEGYKMVQDYLLKNTGYLVDSIRFDGTNLEARKNLLLASGEKVDVWWENWTQYVDQGMIQPITDYMQYIPSVIKAWKNYGGFQSVTDRSGKVWGIPRICNRVFYQTFVREDWLKKLNLKAPTTFKDFEAVIYAMKKADPFGKGETIPLITRSGMGSMEYHFLGGFTKHGRSNWMDKDGLLKPYYLQDGYYEFLETMARWYADGIVHKENPSWDVNTVRSHIASGRVAASAAYTTDLSNQALNTRTNYPGAKWWYYEKGMTGNNGELCETQISGDDECCMFNAKASKETLIGALKVIEFCYSDWRHFKTVQTGIEGVHWEFDKSYKDAETLHITKFLKSPIVYKGDFWFSIGLPMEADCITYDPDGQQNYHNYMLRRQGDTFAAKTPFDINVIYNNAQLRENVLSLGDINRMVNEEISKFYVGQRKLNKAEWAKFIDQLYAAGLNDYIKEMTRQYKAWKGIR